MTLLRWSPLEEMSILRNQIDRIFEPTIAHGNKRSLNHLFPVEVTEKPGEYLLKVMVPGISPDQIKVESTAREVVITAETRPRELDKGENVFLSEFHYGQFSRHLSFPLPIETEKIEAEYEFGLLIIKIPKIEAAQRKHVEVKVNKG